MTGGGGAGGLVKVRKEGGRSEHYWQIYERKRGKVEVVQCFTHCVPSIIYNLKKLKITAACVQICRIPAKSLSDIVVNFIQKRGRINPPVISQSQQSIVKSVSDSFFVSLHIKVAVSRDCLTFFISLIKHI